MTRGQHGLYVRGTTRNTMASTMGCETVKIYRYVKWTGFGSRPMRMTLERIREEGLEALRARLGRAGTIRFLQQFETGEGDYARQRRAWVDGTSLEQIRRRSAERDKQV